MKYDALIIDTMNLFYRVSIHKTESSSLVSKKKVYKESICNFIKKIDELIEEYSYHDGDIYLLFDNPTSRIELKSAFMHAGRKEIFPDYKANRTKESREFYNSIGLIKYYYLLKEKNYRCLQASRLEADDLVKPLLKHRLQDKTALLISTDLDWAKEISNTVHWLKTWKEVVEPDQLSQKLNFHVTEASLITYKALYGDSADNIPNLLKEDTFQEFRELSSNIQNPLNLIDWANSNEKRELYPMLIQLKELERQYRINIQLISSIPVDEIHLKHIIANGRDSVELRMIVERAIGLRSSQKKYEFGNVKRSRV